MSDHGKQAYSLSSRPVAAAMKIDLLCGDDGKAWLLHEKPLPADLGWVEYDSGAGIVTLVDESGQACDLGLPIHESMRSALEKVSEITALRMRDGRIARSRIFPFIVQMALH